jgi:hypothetical protein
VSQIKKGDLVMVVHATPCGHLPKVGTVFVAAEVEKPPVPLYCTQCGRRWKAETSVYGYEDYGFDIRRLKRIPPLDELEREQEKKELTA